MYAYTPPGLAQKLRFTPGGEYILPDTIHAWGLWVDPASDEVIITTQNHTGDFVTEISCVQKSTDGGQSWQVLATVNDFHPEVYRAMDIIGFNGKLYLVSRPEDGPFEGTNRLLESSDGGVTWSTVANVSPDHQARLVIHREELVILDYDLESVYTIDSDGSIELASFPGFQIASYYEPTWERDYVGSNVMVSANGLLYFISDDGRVIMTQTFDEWEVISDSDLE